MKFTLSSFIKGLSGRFGRNEVQKSCELVSDSLRQHTLPAYDAAVEFFKEFRIRSKEGKAVDTVVRKYIKVNGSTNSIGAIRDALNDSIRALEAISKKSETLYADHESNAALSFQKATYLRLVSNITFVNDYARKLLNYIYTAELAVVNGGQGVEKELSPADVRFIEDNMVNFAICLRVLQRPFDEVTRNIDAMPDALVSDASEEVMRSNFGEKSIDPLSATAMVFPVRVSVAWNPFYLFGMLLADFQNACYKASREEVSLLQMRLLNLQKINEKKPDANLQFQIEKMQERVDALNYDIARQVKKYA